MVLRRWVGGCACGALLALGGAAEAEAAVSVYPGDGTPDVSPRTQITLRGEPASALAGLVVTGSRSGRHSGSLRPDPDGQGASFFPSRSFVVPEQRTRELDRPRVHRAIQIDVLQRSGPYQQIRDSIEIKVEIEKLREQVQNIE